MSQNHRIEWDEVSREALELLIEYVRIDTINPPGNEVRACEWLGRILEREGIEYQQYDAGNGRVTLVATLSGDGTRGGPLILLNHTDVVPFEREFWTVDPMGGEVLNGYVWGRGTQDMKGMAIMELMTFLLHRRMDLTLTRDLTFMAVADEEAGGEYGVEFLDREHPELLECDFVINEGGNGQTELFGAKQPIINIGVAEKSPLWLKLSTSGRPGHGSIPHDDNAAERLVRAVARIATWERDLIQAPEVMEYFLQLHRAGIMKDYPTEEALAVLADEDLRIKSVQTNTITLTTLNAGMKHNVIPASADATLDCRLVPGYAPDRFISELRDVINDPRVEIETVFSSSTPASPTDTELFKVMTGVLNEAIEDVTIVPSVSTGFTDSRVFRRRGIAAYGFVPILVAPEDRGGAHGNDERISLENLNLGTELLHATVRGICG